MSLPWTLSILLFIEGTFCQTGVPYWDKQYTDVLGDMRGISAVNGSLAWSCGSSGSVLRTLDGGETWDVLNPPGGLSTNLRDIHAFNDTTAVAMSAGLPAMFWKTVDSGVSWTRTFYSNTPGTFFNAFDFWDTMNGITFGDPIDGRLLIMKTTDGGDSWTEAPIEERPIVPDGVVGFAASGSCIKTQGEQNVFIVLGGSKALVLKSTDRGKLWQSSEAPIQSGTESSGILSIDFKNDLEGIIVGGDIVGDNATSEENAAVTRDGGESWELLAPDKNPSGYRSAVAYFDDDLVLTVGRESSGYAWPLEDGFNFMNVSLTAISVAKSPDGNAAYASGIFGGVARLKFK